MKPDPATHEPAFLEAVRQAYGLPVEGITFFTTGWASYCYHAETAAGERYLLKAYDESLPEPMLATSREFYLPLTYELCTRNLLPQIACPVPAADGSFSVCAGPYRLIVFHFIEGETVGFGRLPDDVEVKLAALVGRLHKSTRELELASPLVEGFEIAFDAMLPEALDTLAHTAPDGNANWRGFQDVLLPRRGEILGYLERLKGLQAVVRTRAREVVVCHTDLHGGNLLVDSAGRLHILDWEGAMLAPPEQDLFFFAGHDTFWDLFWPTYASEFGAAHLDLDTLGFYYYRRGLEDLADWLQRLMHTDQDDEHDSRALHWADETVADLATVETTLGKIAAHL